jgi:acyl-CoA dehydrogenase
MLDQETLEQLLDTIRRFVRERLVPNEDRIAEEDAIPPEIVAEMRELGCSGCRSRKSTAASGWP